MPTRSSSVNMADGFGTSEVTVDVGIWGMLVSATVRYSNKEFVSVAIWINDAKEDHPLNERRPWLPVQAKLLL